MSEAAGSHRLEGVEVFAAGEHRGRTYSPDDLRQHLSTRVAKWWIPETFAFIGEVPKTSVGKFDKKVLRQRLKDGELQQVGSEQEPANA